MKRRGETVLALVVALLLSADASAEESPRDQASGYARWKNGPSKDANFFPIAVWLQSPANAPKYQALGINLYVGLWKGPTAEQIAELKRHGMPVICEQNDYALKHLDEKTIVGWMHGDEPDTGRPTSRTPWSSGRTATLSGTRSSTAAWASCRRWWSSSRATASTLSTRTAYYLRGDGLATSLDGISIFEILPFYPY